MDFFGTQRANDAVVWHSHPFYYYEFSKGFY